MSDAIGDVGDTALWVAYYRGLESARADHLFDDPYALRLAGEKGKKIAEAMLEKPNYTEWTLVIRTAVIDRYLTEAIAGGVDMIINLGAGMDARPFRMDLPASLPWIEIDSPRIIEYKQSVLKGEQPRCKLLQIKLDLSDRGARKEIFTDLNSRAKNILVLTEGVLPYLTPEQVTALAEDLHACPNFKFWLTEYFNQEVYRHIDTPKRRAKMKNAPFVFFPPDWHAFFKERGWSARETRYMGVEALKYGRSIPAPWFAFLFRFIPGSKKFMEKMLRYTGYTLFQRA
jgi:methyltransferase (TIGR00027 family)